MPSPLISHVETGVSRNRTLPIFAYVADVSRALWPDGASPNGYAAAHGGPRARLLPGVAHGHQPLQHGRVLLRPAPGARGRGDRPERSHRARGDPRVRGPERAERRRMLRDADDWPGGAVLQGRRNLGPAAKRNRGAQIRTGDLTDGYSGRRA